LLDRLFLWPEQCSMIAISLVEPQVAQGSMESCLGGNSLSGCWVDVSRSREIAPIVRRVFETAPDRNRRGHEVSAAPASVVLAWMR
jgi:hypothetical protein